MITPELVHAAGLVGAVLLGAALQRVTGVGFALVAAPLLVVLLGPFDGVLVVNLLGTVTASLIFLRVRREVEYKRVLWLLAPALAATIPGAWVARHAHPAVLSLVIALLVLMALAGSLLVRRTRLFSGRGGALAGGLTSGFMNVTAGVGGPAIAAYAVASRWPHPAFAASVQLYFMVLGAGSILAKFSFPVLESTQWIGMLSGLVAGIVIGDCLARWIPAIAARRAAIVLAVAGALAVLAKGVLDWPGQ